MHALRAARAQRSRTREAMRSDAHAHVHVRLIESSQVEAFALHDHEAVSERDGEATARDGAARDDLPALCHRLAERCAEDRAGGIAEDDADGTPFAVGKRDVRAQAEHTLCGHGARATER